jgi:hypothetical protein
MSDFDQTQPRDAYFSKRIRAGKRTYYFDVKATRGNDYYLTITESKRKPGESEDRPMFEKHKIFLYKEDFDKFAEGFQEALGYIRQRRNDEESNGYQPSEMNHSEINEVSESAPSDNFARIEFEDLGK